MGDGNRDGAIKLLVGNGKWHSSNRIGSTRSGGKKMEALMERAKIMIERLDFNGCIELFNQLPSGHPMIDLVFDRMEAIDPERFEEWL
nr:MAG: hypothetical protein [Bacteriophage sp.]UVY62197.1 MAG: hypothetical protein [Bacteriophage sp.]